MEKNPDRVSLRSPRGTLKYPKLVEIDHGTDKFPDKDGSWNTRVIFDTSDPAVQAYTAKLDEMMERAKELAEEQFAELPVKARKELEKKGGLKADAPYSEVYDEETEEPTGEIEMRFKRKAGGTRKDGKKWAAPRPDLFDSAKPKPKPIPKGVDIWGGTIATIHADFEPYFVAGTGSYGLQRRLNAVQVFQLVSAGGQRSASSYGFESDVEGFDASSIEASNDRDMNDADASDGEDADEDANF
jgi:hypothetical protein